MDVSNPQQPSYGQQMSDTLLAQEQAQTGTGSFSSLGPMINLESNPVYGQPAWANLSLQTINGLLTGSPGGTSNQVVPGTPTTAGWYDTNGNLVSTDQNYRSPGSHTMSPDGRPTGGQSPKSQGMEWRDSVPTSTTQQVTTPGTPGLLSIYDTIAQQQAATQAKTLTQQRTSDINDVMNLGPQSMAATRASDPQSAALVDTMTGQAQQGLNLGTNLSPQQTRTVTQGVLANNQGMLTGTGNAGNFALALGLSSYGNQLQQMRQQYANNTLTARQGFYGDAFNRVLGRSNGTNPSSAVSQAQGISAGSYNPYNPESQMASNIMTSNQQTGLASSAASASATSGLISGIMGGLGSAGGGYLSTL